MFYVGVKQDDGSAGIDAGNGSHSYQTLALASKAAEEMAMKSDTQVIVLQEVACFQRRYVVSQVGGGSSPVYDPRDKLK